MTALASALELQAETIRGLEKEFSAGGRERSVRESHMLDRHFSALLDLLSGRIAHLIRCYRLQDIREDAEQACAIGVHRALESYDPNKASFSTHVTWQLRGELQGLRHRIRLDQRDSAQKAGAKTASLEDMAGPEGGSFEIADESAYARAEAGAAQRMARSLADRLFGDYAKTHKPGRLPVKPGTLSPGDADKVAETLARERQIVTAHLFGGPDNGDDGTLTSEQKRQVTRRVLRHFDRQLRAQPRYAAAMTTIH